MNTYTLYWAPEGKQIGQVQAKDELAAIRQAPKPYRKYLGEIYAKNQDTCLHPYMGGVRCPDCGKEN